MNPAYFHLSLCGVSFFFYYLDLIDIFHSIIGLKYNGNSKIKYLDIENILMHDVSDGNIQCDNLNIIFTE